MQECKKLKFEIKNHPQASLEGGTRWNNKNGVL
jgi:hypothetical protein